jgi:hypothetical protein
MVPSSMNRVIITVKRTSSLSLSLLTFHDILQRLANAAALCHDRPTSRIKQSLSGHGSFVRWLLMQFGNQADTWSCRYRTSRRGRIMRATLTRAGKAFAANHATSPPTAVMHLGLVAPPFDVDVFKDASCRELKAGHASAR